MAENTSKEGQTQSRISEKVLFVRNLPYRLSDEEFEQAFSDIGPLKRAFVAREKGIKDKCRGFGYVTFALSEDAKKAKDTGTTIGGRKLKIAFADKRPRKKPRKRRGGDEDQGTDSEEDVETSHQTQTEVRDKDQLEHGLKRKDKREDINKLDLQRKPVVPVKKAVAKDESEVSKDEEDLEALPVKTSKINVETAEKTDDSQGKKRKPKSQRKQAESDAGRTVVITGLSEGISNKQVYKRCRKAGDIEKTTFPVEGREKPTAYLLFNTHKQARQALLSLDQKLIKGSVVKAVLLSKEGKSFSKHTLDKSKLIIRNLAFKCTESILKETFSAFGKVIESSVPTRKEGKRNRKRGFGFVQFANVFDAANAVEKMNMQEILGRTVAVDFAVPKGEYQTLQDKQENIEAHRSKIKEGLEEESGEKDEDVTDHAKPEDHESSETENEDEMGSEDDDDDDDDDDDNEDDEKDEAENPKRESDVKEGLTIFIRNLSFNSSEQSVASVFKQFGPIVYCKLVVNQFTEQNRGTAFVKFRDSNSVVSCLAKSEGEEDGGGLHLDGHKLHVSMAVSRGKAQQMIQDKKDAKKEPRDKRNLYLAREGVIIPGSNAAEGLSKADILKRQKAEVDKKAKLKNPDYFVSTNRLCVRNLPLKVDEKALRTVFSKSTGTGKPAKIVNVLIMRNKERVDSSGKGRSMGFGFVEFANHRDALSVLRATNNNPDVFGAERRPIVEFAIENSLALKAKQERLVKQKKREWALQSGRENAREQSKTNKEKRLQHAADRREKRKRKKEAKRKRKLEGTIKNSENGVDSKEDRMKEMNKVKLGLKKATERQEKKREKLVAAKVGPVSRKPKNFSKRKQTICTGTLGNKVQFETMGPRKNTYKQLVTRKGAKRKEKEMKDESQFNDMVHKYKAKLFGEDVASSSAKRARWFE